MSFSLHPEDDASLPSSSADRRQHPRQPIIPRLYVILDAAKTDGILNDVSESGVALDIVGPAPQDDYIAVDFEMSEIGQRFEARGRIMWRDDATKKLGVHFDDLPEASRNQIRKWLAKKSPAAPSPAATAPAAAPVQETPKTTPATAVPPIPTPTIAATAPVATFAMNPQHAPSASPALPTILAPVADMPARDSVPTAPPVPMALPTVTAAPEHTLPPQRPAPPKLETLKSYEVITGTQYESAQGVLNIPPAPLAQPAAPAATPTPTMDQLERDRIAENLLQSFSPPSSAKTIRDSFVKSSPPSIFSATQSSSTPSGRNWVAITVAVAMLLLLALGFLTYRSVARNASNGPVNISKAGLPSDLSADPSSPYGSSSANGVSGSGANSTPPPNSPAGSANSAHSSCVPLGPPSDKVRLFLWAEKETPQAILDAYTKNLTAVPDVRIVDQAPYDLVLYVNGVAVNPNGSDAGYLYTSRVFRPWHCGESLPQLEQTEVNESLHYVPDSRLDQRVQAETAYLILHTFEKIRTEGQKQ